MMIRELTRIIRRKEYMIMTMILFLAVFVDTIMNCMLFFGEGLSNVYPAYNMTVLYNVSKSPLRLLFVVMLPIATAVFASDIQKKDSDRGICNMLYVRQSKRKSITAQASAIFLSVFIAYFSALIISVIFSVVAFPLYGYGKFGEDKIIELLYSGGRWNYPVTDGFSNLLLNFKNLHPYLNLFVFAFFRSVIAAVFALLAYGVAFLRFVNRYAVFLSSFLLYNGIELSKIIVYKIAGRMGIEVSNTPLKYLRSNLLNMNPNGNGFTYTKGILFYFIVALLLIVYGIKREEIR